MCGITGYVIRESSSREVSEDVLKAMVRTLAHRGPDDEGYFWSSKIGLGNRRLSIIDLSSAGRQPIWNEDGTVCVVLNGEVYNYRELRAALLDKGHRFASHSDTEVIVHLYEIEGERCFELLDGMYAIALWDSLKRRLFLARDRFGEKPIYYLLNEDGIAFASELKALSLFPSFRRELNWEALEQFLSLGYILAPYTPYQSVYKLLPGHYLAFDQITGDYKVQSYWDMPDWEKTDIHRDEKEYVDSLKALLVNSVQSRLVSDVPVGAFLSGGVDSSLIVAAMVRLVGDRVRTFSIGFQFSKAHNENPVAKQAAQHLGVEHNSLWVDFADVLEVIEKLPWLCDEPLGDPALISVYLITRFAKENGVTVMLSGDGGDELFLGYPIYRWVKQLAFLYRLPILGRQALAISSTVASLITQNSRLEKVGHILREPNLLCAAYTLTGYGAWSLRELDRLVLIKRDFSVENTSFASAFSGLHDQSVLLGMAQALLVTYLPDNNLSRMDRASMANAVETRAPFLNPSLAEFAAKLPLEMKIRGGVFKYLLRRVLREYLPEDIVQRPKHGFNALPMATWLRKELRFLIDQYLDPVRLRKQGIFRSEMVREVVRQHMVGGRFNHWWKLWLLIVLQMWLEQWA
ncbi:MAG: asparagine synthase (glutamine-hydrolyzing) [Candidatus Methanomethylicaceae archaeon]